MSDNNEVTSTLTGGVTRVQIGKAEEISSGNGDTLRDGVSDGSTISISRDGEVKTFGGVTRATATHEYNPEHGILASARSPGGSRTAPLTDHSVVTVDGTDMSIGAAIQNGILQRGQSGGYVETGKKLASLTTPQSQPVAAPQAAEMQLHPASALAVDALSNSIPHQLVDRITQHIAVHGAASAIAKFEGNSTMSASDFAATVEAVEVGFAAHAAHALGKLGIDGEQFDAWARKNAASEYNTAKLTHAFSKSTSAYDALAQRYLSRTASGPEALAEQGTTTRTNAKGVLEVRTALGWIPAATARRAGIIS